MKIIEKNSTFNIFYSGKNRQTGLTVTFDIWDDSSGVRATDLPATEITTKGIYKASFTAPNSDLYLLIKGTDGSQFSPMVVQVGSPSKKVFYTHKFFETGKVIEYTIYEANESMLQSGNLTEILEGFYYADVSALTVPYFFKVPPLTKIVKQ